METVYPVIGNTPFLSGIVLSYLYTSRAGGVHSCAFANFGPVIGVRGYLVTSRAGFVDGRHMTSFVAIGVAGRNLLSLCKPFLGV